MAVFGGKNPHTQFTIVGGCTNYNAMTPDRIAEFTSLWKETKQFVDDVYIPDLLAVPASTRTGAASRLHQLHAFGEFPTDVSSTEKYMESCYLPAGVMMNRDLKKVDKVDLKEITEHVKYSWYKGDEAHHPYEGVTDPSTPS
jgi:[NiFe] hydrogenase large subunit